MALKNERKSYRPPQISTAAAVTGQLAPLLMCTFPLVACATGTGCFDSTSDPDGCSCATPGPNCP